MSGRNFTLNTGAKIPAIGLGTWQSPPGEVKNAVLAALKAGYKHIDCAWIYGNETEIGEAFREAFEGGIVKREDLFVTTKLWCTYHTRVDDAIDQSLQRLGLDYIDLYLMHWPVALNPNGNDDRFPTLPDGTRDFYMDKWNHKQTWALMEKAYGGGKGKVRAIGVSNYSVPFLQDLLAGAAVTPAANQIENHPYLPQQEVVDFCARHNIAVEAYSPLGSTGSPLFKEEAVEELAKTKGVGEGTILLSYAVARGVVVLPKSVTPSRIEQNLIVVDLSKSEIDALERISKTKGVKRYVAPPLLTATGGLGFPDQTPQTAKA